jgi:endonuclease YncB( thermonuclease family)
MSMSPPLRKSSHTGTTGTGGGTRSLGSMVGKIAGALIAMAILALLARYCGVEQDVHFMAKDKVAAVDGDTLRSPTAEVRLYGIDALELDQTCTDQNGKDWTCGRDAQTKLKSLIARRAIDCTPKGRDPYNRTLAVCRTSSTPDLGEALVREGLATNSGIADKPGPYAAAQADAQAAKRGMWKGTIKQAAAAQPNPPAAPASPPAGN